MIIIVEGIDRVGKTTLVDKLSAELNIPKLKLERIGGNDDYLPGCRAKNQGRGLGLIEAFNVCKRSVIMDRFHLTETVYNAFRHPNDILQTGYFDDLELIMNKSINDYVLILVKPTSIERSSSEHGSDLTEHSEYFDRLFDRSIIRYKYVCNYNTIDRMVDLIKLKNKLEDELKARVLDISMRLGE